MPGVFLARLVSTFFWYLYDLTFVVFLPPFFVFGLVLSLHIAIFLPVTFLHDHFGGILNPFISDSHPMVKRNH